MKRTTEKRGYAHEIVILESLNGEPITREQVERYAEKNYFGYEIIAINDKAARVKGYTD
jgi:hypothetical protein